MVSPDFDQFAQPEEGSVDFSNIPAAYLGGFILRDCIRVEDLPIRLNQDFVYRPWPKHDLRDKIVHRAFVPIVSVAPPDAAWVLEVVGDEKIRINGKNRKISGELLVFFNLMLLTRDWALRGDEFVALGFGGDRMTSKAKTMLFTSMRHRLRHKIVPHDIFTIQNRTSGDAFRLNPAMQLVDRREWPA